MGWAETLWGPGGESLGTLASTIAESHTVEAKPSVSIKERQPPARGVDVIEAMRANSHSAPCRVVAAPERAAANAGVGIRAEEHDVAWLSVSIPFSIRSSVAPN